MKALKDLENCLGPYFFQFYYDRTINKWKKKNSLSKDLDLLVGNHFPPKDRLVDSPLWIFTPDHDDKAIL